MGKKGQGSTGHVVNHFEFHLCLTRDKSVIHVNQVYACYVKIKCDKCQLNSTEVVFPTEKIGYGLFSNPNSANIY